MSVMLVLAQAMAEYGSLSSGSSGAASALLNRINNAGTEEYIVGGLVLLAVMVVISKLLDAA